MLSLIYKLIFFMMWVILVTHAHDLREKREEFKYTRFGQFINVFMPRNRRIKYHRFTPIQKVSIVYGIAFLSLFIFNYNFIQYLILQIPFAIVPVMIIANKFDFNIQPKQPKEKKRNTYFARKRGRLVEEEVEEIKEVEMEQGRSLGDMEDILDEIEDDVLNSEERDVVAEEEIF